LDQVITFHSNKGGVGKTTLVTNLGALLAKKGKKVCILDLDINAPSIHTYFGLSNNDNNKNTLNNYLIGECGVDDLLIELTPMPNLSNIGTLPGKIFGCLSSSKRIDILKIEALGKDKNRMNLFKRFIELVEMIRNNGIDYIIIDSSSGHKFWTKSAIGLSDIIFIVLKMQDVGTFISNQLPVQTLDQFKEKEDSRNRLVLNMVPGYCVPNQNGAVNSLTTIDDSVKRFLDTNVSDITAYIPCYCDIQFAQREFLTVLSQANHPFSKNIAVLEELIHLSKSN
jgi:MinD-like ATPase involved in chromosome partitioning or flagellar assembly